MYYHNRILIFGFDKFIIDLWDNHLVRFWYLLIIAILINYKGCESHLCWKVVSFLKDVKKSCVFSKSSMLEGCVFSKNSYKYLLKSEKLWLFL